MFKLQNSHTILRSLIQPVLLTLHVDYTCTLESTVAGRDSWTNWLRHYVWSNQQRVYICDYNIYTAIAHD